MYMYTGVWVIFVLNSEYIIVYAERCRGAFTISDHVKNS